MQFMLPNCDACIILFIYFDRNKLTYICIKMHTYIHVLLGNPSPNRYHSHSYRRSTVPSITLMWCKRHILNIDTQAIVVCYFKSFKKLNVTNPSHHLHDKF